jgi:transposase
MQVKVLGAECRRRWSYDEKVRLVEETLQTWETVCGVARRHGVAHSLLFTWRRQARRGCLGGDASAALVPVEITAGPIPVSTSESQPASSPPQRAKIGIIEILVVRFHGRAGIAETDSTYEALSHFVGFDTPLSLGRVCPNFRQ